MSNVKVFSGTKSLYLAQEIANELGVELGNMRIPHFADGEFEVYYEESIRGAEVFLIQSTFPNSDNLMELLLMIDAAKRASAERITAVIPYFGWARQDRKDKPRVSIAAKLVANLLSAAGVDSVITMDLHADQLQGFFDVPVNHLFASSVFIPYLQQLELPNLTIASPDVGGAKRANSFAKYFDVPLVLCHKQRASANIVDKMTIIGEVEGKDIVLVDDMVDTAGTICTAADMMKAAGASSVRAIASHALMSYDRNKGLTASQKVMQSALDEIIFTNSIPFDNRECPKATVLSIARLFADTIKRIHNNESISTATNYLL